MNRDTKWDILPNNITKFRNEKLMSASELSPSAGVSDVFTNVSREPAAQPLATRLQSPKNKSAS